MADLVSRIDPQVMETQPLSEAEIDDLLGFLEALADPSAASLASTVPWSVPSGLSVD